MKLRSAMGATESSPNVVLLISEMEASASIGSLGEELPSLMEEFQSLWRLPPFQSQSIRGERYSICSHLSHRVHLFFFFPQFFQSNDIFLSEMEKKKSELWSFNSSSFSSSYSFSFVSNGSLLCKSDKELYHYAIIFESSIIVAFLSKSLK